VSLPALPAEPATLPPPGDAPTAAAGPENVSVPGYEILRELGRGGMGVVYQARQTGLGRVVALKMILAGGYAGEAELARFRTEAEAIARLQHPNIVQIHEVGEHAGLPYFALEFCAGGSLEKKLAGTPLPPREAAALVETLARAVHAAHQKGILHRDLSPGNVLLTEEGTPKISDFGLAKKLGEAGQTASGAVLGTPSYMAPEQAGGKSKEVGPEADTYALGAILYECLTGRPPFKAATALDTLLQVAADEPVPPKQLQSKVPRDLETICLKCLRKEPARRYRSAEKLADDLRRFLAGEPIRARPVGGLERAGKWVRRNPALAALAASLLLGVCSATVLAVRANEKAAEAVREAGRADREADEAKAARGKAIEEAGRADREAKEAKRLAGEEEKARREAVQNEKAAKYQAYRADVVLHRFQINAALQAWQRHDVAAADAILADVPGPFQQTWEYRHVRALCRRKAMPCWGHGVVSSVAYSPDGQRLVSGSYDGR
jgi:hypothetical protein